MNKHSQVALPRKKLVKRGHKSKTGATNLDCDHVTVAVRDSEDEFYDDEGQDIPFNQGQILRMNSVKMSQATLIHRSQCR